MPIQVQHSPNFSDYGSAMYDSGASLGRIEFLQQALSNLRGQRSDTREERSFDQQKRVQDQTLDLQRAAQKLNELKVQQDYQLAMYGQGGGGGGGSYQPGSAQELQYILGLGAQMNLGFGQNRFMVGDRGKPNDYQTGLQAYQDQQSQKQAAWYGQLAYMNQLSEASRNAELERERERQKWKVPAGSI